MVTIIKVIGILILPATVTTAIVTVTVILLRTVVKLIILVLFTVKIATITRKP